MKLERGGHAGKGVLIGRLEADARRPPEAVLGLFHVAVEVAEVDDARRVALVEAHPPPQCVLGYPRCTHLAMVSRWARGPSCRVLHAGLQISVQPGVSLPPVTH